MQHGAARRRKVKREKMPFRSCRRSTEEGVSMRMGRVACAAFWPSARATHLASRLAATPQSPSSHSRSQSNQFLFRWLLFKGVWPLCMWPFLDFSLSSSPSSLDSVSSLSLRSSWTMSCQEEGEEEKEGRISPRMFSR